MRTVFHIAFYGGILKTEPGSETELLICHLLPARRRARGVAEAEVVTLLADLGASVAPGGPLSERGGVFWVRLPTAALERAIPRLRRLGYTQAVDRLDPAPARSRQDLISWKGASYRLVRLHGWDPEAARAAAPDRRVFLLESHGQIREVRGYRGDGQPLSRRGLPVCDARLLVNLSGARPNGLLLDPFAGAGGIASAAARAGCRVLTADIDPVLGCGLAAISGGHCVADAGLLPFASNSIPAIATEPPYHPEALPAVLAALGELARVVTPGGRIALLCAEDQAEPLRSAAVQHGLGEILYCPIDRKGLPVAVLVWERPSHSG